MVSTKSAGRSPQLCPMALTVIEAPSHAWVGLVSQLTWMQGLLLQATEQGASPLTVPVEPQSLVPTPEAANGTGEPEQWKVMVVSKRASAPAATWPKACEPPAIVSTMSS